MFLPYFGLRIVVIIVEAEVLYVVRKLLSQEISKQGHIYVTIEYITENFSSGKALDPTLQC